jgi:hypothetical protein
MPDVSMKAAIRSISDWMKSRKDSGVEHSPASIPVWMSLARKAVSAVIRIASALILRMMGQAGVEADVDGGGERQLLSDQQEPDAVCDRVEIMLNGRVAAGTTAATLMANVSMQQRYLGVASAGR